MILIINDVCIKVVVLCYVALAPPPRLRCFLRDQCGGCEFLKNFLRKNSAEKKFYIDKIRFYTGFISYEVLLIFFEFLGPYWGAIVSDTSKTTAESKDQRFVLVLPRYTTWISFTTQNRSERFHHPFHHPLRRNIQIRMRWI